MGVWVEREPCARGLNGAGGGIEKQISGLKGDVLALTFDVVAE